MAIAPRDREEEQRGTRPSTDLTRSARRFGLAHLAGGLLGFVGPAVWGNDDDLVNTDPGLFLGVVAVDGRHALMHVLFGVLGLGASRDGGAARRYFGLNAIVFGLLAALGYREFGLERGVHFLGGMAVDGYANVAHAFVATLAVRLLGTARTAAGRRVLADRGRGRPTDRHDREPDASTRVGR